MTYAGNRWAFQALETRSGGELPVVRLAEPFALRQGGETGIVEAFHYALSSTCGLHTRRISCGVLKSGIRLKIWRLLKPGFARSPV